MVQALRTGAFLLVIIVLLSVLSACSGGKAIVACRVKKVPSCTEYPVGFDGYLDLTGICLVGVQKNKFSCEFENGYLLKPYADYDIENHQYAMCLPSYYTDGIPVIYWDDSEVDYSTAGSYTVYLHFLGNKESCDSFNITVL